MQRVHWLANAWYKANCSRSLFIKSPSERRKIQSKTWTQLLISTAPTFIASGATRLLLCVQPLAAAWIPRNTNSVALMNSNMASHFFCIIKTMAQAKNFLSVAQCADSTRDAKYTAHRGLGAIYLQWVARSLKWRAAADKYRLRTCHFNCADR
jgi:hypothetical protein